MNFIDTFKTPGPKIITPYQRSMKHFAYGVGLNHEANILKRIGSVVLAILELIPILNYSISCFALRCVQKCSSPDKPVDENIEADSETDYFSCEESD